MHEPQAMYGIFIIFFFFFFSFFPNVLQPVISILVNPIHLGCLRIGLVKKPSPHPATALTSVNVTIPGVDPQNIERRRQIALKALSERLSKTTDSQRQNQLPKSIPLQGSSSKQFSKHQHFHVGDDQTFAVPAIPLPPPPSSVTTTTTSAIIQIPTNTSTTNLVEIDQSVQDPKSITQNPSSTYDINP